MHFRCLPFLVVLLTSSGARGALPPLRNRQDFAKVVATGVLESLNSSVVDAEGRRLRSDDAASQRLGGAITHRIFDGTLRVATVAKQPDGDGGSGVAMLASGSALAFSFRKVILPSGMVGNTGQAGSLPTVGQRLTIYASASPKATTGLWGTAKGGCVLLEPNGFDVIVVEEGGESPAPTQRAGAGTLEDVATESLFFSSSSSQESPPRSPLLSRLQHSRRHGLGNGPAGALRLTRDVTTEECDWLEGDLRAGAVVYMFRGHTYGVVGREGVAVTREEGADAPFFELPADALVDHHV